MAGHSGVSRLADVLVGEVRRHVAQPVALELGTIGSDGSLRLPGLRHPLPPGAYLVCRSLTLADPVATTSSAGAHTHAGAVASDGAHTHTVPRPAELRPLTAGDTVLVAWLRGGSLPVVIDVVVRS